MPKIREQNAIINNIKNSRLVTSISFLKPLFDLV